MTLIQNSMGISAFSFERDWRTYTLTDIHTYRQTDRQTDRQTHTHKTDTALLYVRYS